MNDADKDKNIVYMGYTAEDLATQLDVEKTIDDLPAYQQENAEMSNKAVISLNCFRDIQYGNDDPQKLDIFPAISNNAPIFSRYSRWWLAGWLKKFAEFPS